MAFKNIASSEPHEKPARIMIVEDEGLIARDIEINLQQMGYEVVSSCSSGEEAIISCGKYHPDLVMMDINLRDEMSGIKAASVIGSKFNIPVIYLTSNSDLETVREARETAPVGYLTKPLSSIDMRNTIEIALYNHKLEKKMRRQRDLAAIGEMAAGLMHEINNPNAFIDGNIRFLSKVINNLNNYFKEHNLQDESLKKELDEFPKTLEAIKEGSRRISTIVEKVNIFARDDELGEGIHFLPVDVINEALEICGKTVDLSPEGQLIIDHDSELLKNKLSFRIKGDPVALQQIVINLLDNAAHAVEENDSPQVKFSSWRHDHHLCLEVRDNGHGIDSQHLNQIFKPFYTTKATGAGTGLGLAIVHGLVRSMNGSIDVESKENDGTKFTVTLPFSKTPEEPEPQTKNKTRPTAEINTAK